MIRQPVVAGSFYSAHPAQLEAFVRLCLHKVQAVPAQAFMALSPHAGYMYCGELIAQSLCRLRQPDTLILLGPNHTGRGDAAAVWAEGSWRSPLGETAIDTDMAMALVAAQAGFTADTQAHTHEHSLEVLLPFVQCLWPQTRIVPVAVAAGAQSLPALGIALAGCITRHTQAGHKVSVAISSDMNHFANLEHTQKLDQMALEAFLSLNPLSLLSTVAENQISMCGVLPAALALYACQELGAFRAELVAYTTSARVSGDTSKVVGYAGAAIYPA